MRTRWTQGSNQRSGNGTENLQTRWRAQNWREVRTNVADWPFLFLLLNSLRLSLILFLKLRTFVGLQKKILQYRGRYHLNRTMHPGKKVPKVESENCKLVHTMHVRCGWFDIHSFSSFRKLFSEPGTSSFPRRSLSTLSKMALSASPNTDTIWIARLFTTNDESASEFHYWL